MPRPPVIVNLVNGSDGANTFFVGNLVVNIVGGTADLTDFTIAALLPTAILKGPVGVVTGVPAAGIGALESFQAIIEGEAIVRIEADLVVNPGDRLYVSSKTNGVASNVSGSPRPLYNQPIGIVKSLQTDPLLVLAEIGEVPTSDRQMWNVPLLRGINKSQSPAFRAMGPSGSQSGIPALNASLADATYGSGPANPLVLCVNQSLISRSSGGQAVYGGLTVLTLEAGLTLDVGQEIWLSDTAAGLGTNVKPTTPGSYAVPLGMSTNVFLYDGINDQILMLWKPDRAGTLIT